MDHRTLQAVAPVAGAVLHLLLLAALAVWLMARWRRGADRPVDLAVPLGLIAAWAAAAPSLARALPSHALHPLREGWSIQHVASAAGEVGDESLLADHMWGVWLHANDGLHEQVVLHFVFAGISAILLTTLALRALGTWPGLVLGLLVWTMPTTWVAATTDVQAAVAQAYVALGALLLADAASARGRERQALVVAMLLLAVLMGAHRLELAALGVAGLLGAALAGGRWDRALRLPRAPTGYALLLAPPLILGASAMWLGTTAPSPQRFGQAAWLLAALHPLHVHGLGLPVFLLAMLPLGLVLFAVAGAAHSLVHPARWGLIALALPLVYATARLAAHGHAPLEATADLAAYELYRYMLPMVPAVVALTILGLQSSLQHVPERGFALLLLAVGPFPAAAGWLQVEPSVGPPDVMGPPSSAAQEVQDLARWVAAHPDCVLLAQGHRWGAPPAPGAPAWVALVPRTTSGHRVIEGEAGLPLAAMRERLGPSTCGVAYAGLDCQGGTCPAIQALPVLTETTRAGIPFVHPQHGGELPAVVRTSWHRLPGLEPAL